MGSRSREETSGELARINADGDRVISKKDSLRGRVHTP
jgi:hypothetical protein